MRRTVLLAGLALAAAAGLIAGPVLLARGSSAAVPPKRLVVFELFGSSCPACVDAGEVVDALAESYGRAGRPVVFIEYASGRFLGNRLDRWYDACPNWRACYLPLELVDSGWRWSCGPKDYRAVYIDLVDQGLARPAGAALAAHYTRSGRGLDVTVRVTNHSGRPIGPANDATVNVIVVEQTRVQNTARFARAAAALPLQADLADGDNADYRVSLADAAVADWDRAFVVVLVDFRPDGDSAHYEALQAAIATEGMPATPSPSPTSAPSATPTVPGPPTATPVWTGEPVFLPFASLAGGHRWAHGLVSGTGLGSAR